MSIPDRHEFEDDLRKMIARRQVVTVVGSGVSLATNRQAPTWRALIESAIERCRTLGAAILVRHWSPQSALEVLSQNSTEGEGQKRIGNSSFHA